MLPVDVPWLSQMSTVTPLPAIAALKAENASGWAPPAPLPVLPVSWSSITTLYGALWGRTAAEAASLHEHSASTSPAAASTDPVLRTITSGLKRAIGPPVPCHPARASGTGQKVTNLYIYGKKTSRD